ncbi:MAG: GroES/HSP10 [Candidatus Adlerbacteria bacterium]|nr:GroES/HSP10 [Candidatus Adlerbacteria bacterium]
MKKSKKTAKKAAPKKAVKKQVQKSAAKKPVAAAVSPKNKFGTPYGDRVLIKPQEAEATTSFGLILPDTNKEKPEIGIVIAVGPGKHNEDGELIPLGVVVGDRIMFSKYGVDEVTIEGVEYYLVREDSITFIF